MLRNKSDFKLVDDLSVFEKEVCGVIFLGVLLYCFSVILAE